MHLPRHINQHNFGVWERSNLRTAVEDTRDSPKLNDFGVLSKQKVFKPFAKHRVANNLYFKMLEEFLMLILGRRQGRHIRSTSIKTFHRNTLALADLSLDTLLP